MNSCINFCYVKVSSKNWANRRDGGGGPTCKQRRDITSAKIFRIFSIMQLLENIKNSGQKNS